MGLHSRNIKHIFLSEVVRVCSKKSLPIIIGGDFNIIRRPDEKNNDNYNDRWPFMFNVVIDSLNLMELEMSRRKFTWANRLQNQTFKKLDRILVCIDFESKFPHTTVHALNMEISDHTPLLLSTI
jgi:endonuclease/exonuclease/phosphatase family metal-dependent hydrolase